MAFALSRSVSRGLASTRDRYLRRPAFRRWAGQSRATRWIARRTAGRLFAICSGFVHAQTLLACVDLGLFEMLAARPRSVAWLARACTMPVGRLSTLLEAATALGLVEVRKADLIGLSTLGAAMIGNDGLISMIRHHRLFYADLADPVALVRGKGGTNLAAYWSYARQTGAGTLGRTEVGAYTQLMAASQDYVADDVLSAYRFAQHRHVMDVGGGDGSFVAALLQRFPMLTAAVADLPAVAGLAADRFRQLGLEGRARTHGLDLFATPLPLGADLVTLVRVLHDHDDDGAFRLLQTVYAALPPGGRILVAEPMAHAPDGGSGEAYFAFYLLAMGAGRVRSSSEIKQLLALAGFAEAWDVHCPTGFLIQGVAARRDAIAV